MIRVMNDIKVTLSLTVAKLLLLMFNISYGKIKSSKFIG